MAQVGPQIAFKRHLMRSYIDIKNWFEKKLGGVIFRGVSTRRGSPRGGGFRGRGLIKKEVDYLNTPLGQGPANLGHRDSEESGVDKTGSTTID